MRFIKKFEKFVESAEPQVAPARPDVKPDVKPGKPLQKPQRPSPIRRDKPSVEPEPKMKKSTADAVAERFVDLMVEGNEDVKKYAKTV